MEKKPTVTLIPAHKKVRYLKRVGIYARVSTARAEQIQSLSAQISGLTRHVYSREHCVLKDIYMDVGSAKTGSRRREFSRLIEDCKSGKLDLVMVKSLSRFGRDTVEVGESVRAILEAGVDIYFMMEDIEVDKNYDETDLYVRAAINQSENEWRSENIKLGLRFRAEHGLSGLYKKPCFGYRKNEQGKLVCDAYQAAVVSHIFEMYLEGKSFAAIIDTLAEEKIPSPRGSEKWSKRSIETILTNVKYTGNVEVLKTNPTSAHYVMENAHMAIISMEDFAAVQNEMKRRAKRKRQTESTSHQFIEEINWPGRIKNGGNEKNGDEIVWSEPAKE